MFKFEMYVSDLCNPVYFSGNLLHSSLIIAKVLLHFMPLLQDILLAITKQTS